MLGLLAGSGSMGAWHTFLLWGNREPFGIKDPQFGLDVGFFVFTLPWLRFVVGFLTMVLVLAFVAAAFTHYVYGGLQLPGRGPHHPRGLRAPRHPRRAHRPDPRGVVLARPLLAVDPKGRCSPASATPTTRPCCPTKAILAVAAVMCAGFFLAAIWTRCWRLPIVGVVLLVVTAVVVGGIYPALIQSLKVSPSEKSLEAPYIERNINATRAAFGLDRVKRIQNPTPAETENKAVLRAAATTSRASASSTPTSSRPRSTSSRPSATTTRSPTPSTSTATRSTADRDTVVAVRELDLDGLPDGQRNWLNDHTVYTHGYGVVAAYGNQRTTDGDPVFFEGSGRSALGKYEPRVYFGELSPAYSVVGAEQGAPPREFDYPAGARARRRAEHLRRQRWRADRLDPAPAAYAVKYREINFLLSDAVNDDSRILDHRTPRERVERVAPWLTLDGNAYPAVVDGRVQWIVDGYTTSANYPYCRLIELDRRPPTR